MRFLSVTSLGCLAACLSAQAGPGILRAPAINPGFQSLGTTPQQVSCERLPGDAPGTWTACVTQGSVLVMGKYDQVNGTFTASTEAAALTGSAPFGLMLEPGLGRYAVYDTSTGVFFATRSGPGVPFGTPALITGVSGTFVDPALGYVGGVLKLFYALPTTAGNSLVMQDLDITTPTAPKVIGSPVAIANFLTSGGIVHSPSPITGPDGDVEGLWMCEAVSADSDMYFKAGLDPAVKPIKVVDATNWRNNGGVAGGRMIYRDSGFPIADVAVAWLLGDEEPPGGTLDVFGAVANTSNLATTALVMSPGVIAPISLPPPLNIGQFALDPTILINFGSLAHTDATQLGTTTLPVPNNPLLKGIRLAIQGLSFVPAVPTYAFTNTAWLVIK